MDLGCNPLSRSFSFFPLLFFAVDEESKGDVRLEEVGVVEDECEPGKEGKLSSPPPPAFSLGERMSFILRPSASRSVRGSPLPAPLWNSDDREEEEDEECECFLEDDPEDAGVPPLERC